MRKSTSNFKAVLIALFAVSLGVEMVSAAGFPSVKDLYGRYKFSGECSYVDMVSGAAGEAPVPATTDYNMAVLPGESENEVKVLGFFGYGGGVTLTYNQEDGTLSGGGERRQNTDYGAECIGRCHHYGYGERYYGDAFLRFCIYHDQGGSLL